MNEANINVREISIILHNLKISKNYTSYLFIYLFKLLLNDRRVVKFVSSWWTLERVEEPEV